MKTDRQIYEEREREYGGWEVCGHETAAVWSAMLRAREAAGEKGVTPYMVALLMAAHKLVRASSSVEANPDHFQDARNYITLAEIELLGATTVGA